METTYIFMMVPLGYRLIPTIVIMMVLSILRILIMILQQMLF